MNYFAKLNQKNIVVNVIEIDDFSFYEKISFYRKVFYI